VKPLIRGAFAVLSLLMLTIVSGCAIFQGADDPISDKQLDACFAKAEREATTEFARQWMIAECKLGNDLFHNSGMAAREAIVDARDAEFKAQDKAEACAADARARFSGNLLQAALDQCYAPYLEARIHHCELERPELGRDGCENFYKDYYKRTHLPNPYEALSSPAPNPPAHQFVAPPGTVECPNKPGTFVPQDHTNICSFI
jgi:hypothetical protein